MDSSVMLHKCFQGGKGETTTTTKVKEEGGGSKNMTKRGVWVTGEKEDSAERQNLKAEVDLTPEGVKDQKDQMDEQSSKGQMEEDTSEETLTKRPSELGKASFPLLSNWFKSSSFVWSSSPGS